MRVMALALILASAGLAGSPVSASALPSAREELVLPMGDIYDQGGTSWCWAYSTFHTLRTYYSSQVDSPWAAATSQLDSPRALREFLAARVPRREKHNPLYFIELAQSEWGLSGDGWHAYFTDPRCRADLAPGGEEGEVATGDEIPEKILAGLRGGSPSVFCNGIHCVSIFGATLQGGEAVTYYVADSLSGFRKQPAKGLPRAFCYLLTRGQ